MVDDILEIGRLYFSAGKRIDRTKMVFRSFIPCKRLRIEVAGTEIAVPAHGEIVETFDSRDHLVAPVGTHSASDTFLGIDLPNECIAGDFLFGGEITDEPDDADGNTIPATRPKHRTEE